MQRTQISDGKSFLLFNLEHVVFVLKKKVNAILCVEGNQVIQVHINFTPRIEKVL